MAERPKSVLLIGHRQSLIKEAASRLGLDCYLDDEATATHRLKRFGYAICLDSLHKIAMGGGKGAAPSQYDVIIIDESEQVISHLLSETLRERIGMQQGFASLEYMIRRAKAVYALDADLGLITLHALKDLRAKDWDTNLRIVFNKPIDVDKRRTMQIYKSKNDLQNKMIEAIRAGKRCFISSNSKKTVELIEILIRKEFGHKFKMVVITSDNSRGEFETHFVQQIQSEYRKIQVLISSPSLGTGIDISFPEGRCEVQEVFGFFYPFVNKHTDIDQQLARVRNPENVSVWFDNGASNFETNLNVIRRQLALSNFVPAALSGLFDDDGNPSYKDDAPLLNIATHVMVAQRSSQNNIVPLFEKLRQENGWDIVKVNKPPNTSLNRKWNEAKQAQKEYRIKGILEARTLSDSDYVDLASERDHGNRLTKADKFALERSDLETTYKRPVDRDLIEMDNGGKLRKQATVFKKIFSEYRQSDSFFEEIKHRLNKETQLYSGPVWASVAVILVAAGLIRNSVLDTSKNLRSDDLELFKTLLRDNRVILEEIFKTSLRKDSMTNPVRQLNVFLGYAGLKLDPTKSKQKSGQSNMEYRLNTTSIKILNSLI